MVVAAAWISVIGSAVTAIAEYGGALLAQRATRMRDLEGRIWERRSAVYEDLMRWVLVIDQTVNDLPQAGGKARDALELSDEQARAPLPSPGIEARHRIRVRGDPARLPPLQQAARLLWAAGQDPGRPRAVSLGDDIRRELRTGREQRQPLAFRISYAWTVARIVLLPSPRGWRAWRSYGYSIKTMTCCSPRMTNTRDAP